MVNKIAIACQGGGSHTAFTAGVLKRILKENKRKFEIVGLSGTSGGAICALLAWYGLLKNDKNLSIEKLDGFWTDNSASSLWDSILNEWILWAVRMQEVITTPEISPYYFPTWAQDQLRGLLKKHVDFDEIKTLVNSSSPRLLIGASDVLSGKFKVFKNDENSADTILASAAIPTFFRSVKIDKTIYWDGLFSQNPPLREFIVDSGEKPDELWVIQINPETRKNEPVSVKEITDRRNELAGNLSLNQEVYFIETVNKWVKAGEFVDKDKFKNIKIKWIKMEKEMDYESKLNRNPTFIQDLMNYGEMQAEDFLK
ncbi:MAG: patatin-like phospholipase family protein [Candidatus Methanoperedens sp.]|nr:patatin-like phospholipase family protein [Candidatus Methanoperedens sp.]